MLSAVWTSLRSGKSHWKLGEGGGGFFLCDVLRQVNPDALSSVTKDAAVSLNNEKGL